MLSLACNIIRVTLGLMSNVAALSAFVRNRFVKRGIRVPFQRPSDGSRVAEVLWATPETVDSAVHAARESANEWRHTEGSRVREALRHIADSMHEHRQELAIAETHSGKPLREDIAAAVEVFRFYAGLADKHHGRTFSLSNSFHSYTVKEPYGVCALITSFNYPLRKRFLTYKCFL
jgi:acyl-CoA reductase-like NAD-dependent aldehyde dehydrogenase